MQRSGIATLDSKKIVVRGKKRLFSIESKILRSFLLVLVFNSWWIPLSIPPTLSGVSCCLIYLIAIVSKSIRNEKKQTPNPKLVPPWQRALCYTSVSWNLSRLCVHTPSLEPDLVSIYVEENLAMSSLGFTSHCVCSSGLSVRNLNPCGIFFLRVQLAHPFALHLEMQPC